MVYNIEWLDEARQSLDAEMEYVFAEFGQKTLAKVYDDLMERVSQLAIFPRIGVHRDDLDYHGHEIRMLHVKVISVVYTIVETRILILYIWNNQQDPERLAEVLGLGK